MVGQSCYTILLVDDAAEDRLTCRRYLDRDPHHCYQILEAESVGEALGVCDRTLPDLVLLDYQLPDDDGLVFLQAWRARYGDKPAPVIMMTGVGNEQIAVEAMKQGAQDYLVKGRLAASGLCRTVQAVLERLHLQQALDNKRQQEQLLADVALRIRQSLDLDTVLQTAVKEVLPLLQADRVLIYRIWPDGTGTVVTESVLPDYPAVLAQSFAEEVFPPESRQLYRQGKTRTIDDVSGEAVSPCLVDFVRQFGVQAKLVVPILLSEQDGDCLWGLLIVHQCSRPRRWQDWEVRLMQRLANQLAIAIHQADLYHHLQTLNADLEAKFAARTLELQESERRFRGIFNHTFQFTGLLSPDGMLLEVNQTALDFAAVQREDVINRPFWETYWWTLSAETQERLRQAVGRAAQGEFIRYEVEVLGKAGKVATIDFSLRPLCNDTGDIILLIPEGRDISERVQLEYERQRTEKALEENQALLKLVMNSLPQRIFWKDCESRFLGCNQQLVADAGLSSPEEIIGKTDFDMPWQAQAALYQADDRRVIASGQPRLNIEEPITKGDNSQGWLRTNKLPLQAADGQMLGVLVSYEDITDHKRIEQALQESEQRYASLMAAAPVGIFRTDAAGHCLYVNDRWCQIAGLTPEEAVGQGWYQGLHPDDQGRVAREWDSFAQSGEMFRLEYRFRRPDGSSTWVFGQAVQEKDRDGRVTGYVGTITDISDRKQAELALQSLVESTAAVTGPDFFSTLAQQLMLALKVKYVMVSQLVGDHLQTLAYWKEGQPQPNVTFALADAPGCDAVIKHGQFFCSKGFLQRFSDYPMPQILQINSYLGIALKSAKGRPIGNLCIMDGADLENTDWAEALLRIFAIRAAAELERQQATEALERLNEDLEARVEARTAALVKSEDRLSAIFSQAAVGIDLATMDGRYLKVNQTLCTLLGYTEDELLGMTVNQVSHPEDLHIGDAERRQLYAGEIESFSIDKRCLHKDGSPVWINLTVSLVYAPSGEPDYTIGIVEDISDRKQAEAALQQSEEKFRQLAENIESVFWSSNADCSVILYVSPAYEAIWGRSCESLYASPQTVIEAIHPQDRTRMLEVFSRQAKGYDEEYRILRPDGTLRWVHDRAFPIYSPEGRVYRITGIAEDITARKQAEEVLNRQLAAIEASIDGIAILNDNSQFIYLNEAHARLYGYEHASELLGQPWQRLYSPAEAQRFEAEVFPVLRQTSAWRGEAVAVRQDGSPFHQEISLTLTTNGELICICRDISERVQLDGQRQRVEQALRESEARFQAFMNYSPALAWITNAEGVLVYASETYHQSLQTRTEDLVSHSIFELYPPRVAEEFLSNIQTVASTHQVLKTLEKAPRKDGTLGDFQVYKFPIPDSSGALWVGCVAIDVTEQRRVEDALRQSEATKQAIIEAIPDLLMRVSAEGIYLDFLSNNQFNLIDPAQLHPNANSWDVLPEYLAQLRVHYVEQTLQSGKTQLYEQELLVHGLQRYEEIRVAPLGSDEVLVMVRDITDRKQAEVELQRTNQELARATRLKDEFLASMSHELRTPLNAILGMTEALQRGIGGTLSERQLKMLSTVESSGQHLLELITDILDLSKVESGNLELDIAEVSLKTLCETSVTFIKQAAFKKHIRLSSQWPPGLGVVCVDERRLRQVLINLLSNAVKFTPPEGQIRLEVQVKAAGTALIDQSGELAVCEEPVVCLAVHDTGIGIAPEHQDRLFKPFVQIDSRLNRQYEGTGLGLALSQRIVNLHGGWITLESALGQGSCFTVCLPQSNCAVSPVIDETAPAGLEREPPPPWDSVPESRPCRILLAEDNEANQETLLAYLEEDGYQILVAKTGHEAVAIAHAQEPDAILMDIQMPGIDGIEAIRQIRQNPALINIPIIALTALAMPEDRENCFQAGANAYFSKPVQIKTLVTTLQSLLASR